jgi:hypothetical protein
MRSKETERREDPTQPKPRAYPYIKFSTPEQAHGASLNRQSARAAAWAAAHSLDLDKELTFQDRGVSG